MMEMEMKAFVEGEWLAAVSVVEEVCEHEKLDRMEEELLLVSACRLWVCGGTEYVVRDCDDATLGDTLRERASSLGLEVLERVLGIDESFVTDGRIP